MDRAGGFKLYLRSVVTPTPEVLHEGEARAAEEGSSNIRDGHRVFELNSGPRGLAVTRRRFDLPREGVDDVAPVGAGRLAFGRLRMR